MTISPWGQFGHQLPKNTPIPEALKLAKLDWTVSLRPLAFDSGADLDNEQKLARAPVSITKQFRALVRDDTNDLLDVVGHRFLPSQNLETMQFFEEFVSDGKAQLEVMGSVNGGRIVWALARLGDNFKIDAKDAVHNYLLLWLPHVQGRSIGAGRTSIRPICMNTLMRAIRQAGNLEAGNYRQTHRLVFDKVSQANAKKVLGLAREQFDEEKEQIKKLVAASSFPLTAAAENFMQLLEPSIRGDELDKIVEELLAGGGPRHAKLMMDALKNSPGATLPSAQGTVWGWLNAVTYSVDHTFGRGADQRLRKAWFGKGAALKRRAFDLAVEIAEG